MFPANKFFRTKRNQVNTLKATVEPFGGQSLTRSNSS